MFPVDPSALVGHVQQTVRSAGVSLTKRYKEKLDVLYSETMGRMPAVPTFKTEDE